PVQQCIRPLLLVESVLDPQSAGEIGDGLRGLLLLAIREAPVVERLRQPRLRDLAARYGRGELLNGQVDTARLQRIDTRLDELISLGGRTLAFGGLGGRHA